VKMTKPPQGGPLPGDETGGAQVDLSNWGKPTVVSQ
jgi:hypothetical protein